MDQLKPLMQWCTRNAFWLGCFFLSATMIGSWVFSSMQLASVQRSNVSAIKKQLKAIKKISDTKADGAEEVNAHPNQSTQEGMSAEMDRTISSIVRAWKKRYKEQKAILTWPEDILGPETCNFFSQIDIPEKVSDPGQGFEKYRKQYYDKIPNFMNRICLDVGVNWKYNEELNRENARKQRESMEEDNEASGMGGMGGMGGGMGGPGGGMGGPGGGMGGPGGGMGGGMMGGAGDNTAYIDEINRYPVNWDETNQALWQQKLTQFQGYDDHKEPVLYPTFMQANMLQQDLWLLEAMFKNIKAVNAGSKSNDMSVIRQIDHLVFGREATVKLGQLSMVDTRLAAVTAPVAGAGSAMGMQGMEDMNMGMMSMGPPGVGMGADAAVVESASYHVRYVDPNFEPIAASQVKAVLGGAALPETNLELIVAKRVPFRLAVKMDERKINEFIAICANSEFVFEINQLRINRHVANAMIEFNGGAKADDGAGMMGGAGRMGGMGGMGGMEGMGGMAGMAGMGEDGGGGMGGMGSGTAEELVPTPVESRTDFQVSVEFYGVVKIYNPVRENFLRLAAGQEVVDETADPTMEAPVAAEVAPANPAVDTAAPAEAADPAAGDAQPDEEAAVPETDAAAEPAAAQPAGG